MKALESRFGSDSVLEFQDGEVLFREGDEGREMFIIQQGAVRITRSSASGPVELTRLERGEFFGEMALLESLPRSATATAVGNTKVIAIQPGGFLLKIRRDPTFAFEMLQKLSRRLRATNEELLSKIEYDHRD